MSIASLLRSDYLFEVLTSRHGNYGGRGGELPFFFI